MKNACIPGVNIQFPISQLILSGEKTVETRTYAIPEKYVGIPLAMIETPGREGQFAARIVAVIQFERSFKYSSEREFYSDEKRHRVNQHSKWKWKRSAAKYGWPVEVIRILKDPVPAPMRKGIVFTKECKL